MALRGSLSEFELSEIFQLISHDGKTGQLVLSLGQKEAFVIFSQGSVVASGNDSQNMQTLLFKYLISIKKYSEEELNELLFLCQGEMRQFSVELIKREYIAKEELVEFIKMGIEDLACSLFLWEDGQYRFDSLESMNEYVLAGVTFPADAITMEAMRRSDEWKRMRKHISPSTVFSVSQNSPRKNAPPAPLSPVYDPSGYIFSLVDSSSTVEVLCKKSIILEYRLYEVLYSLWKESDIVPLAARKSPVKAPVAPSGFNMQEFFSASSTLLAAGAWIVFLYLGCFALRQTVLHQKILARKDTISSIEVAQSEQKIRIAQIQYRIDTGHNSPSPSILKAAGYIGNADIRKSIKNNDYLK